MTYEVTTTLRLPDQQEEDAVLDAIAEQYKGFNTGYTFSMMTKEEVCQEITFRFEERKEAADFKKAIRKHYGPEFPLSYIHEVPEA